MVASEFILFLKLFLGQEGNYKLYKNQYTTNSLALNKHQHNEERDRKRYLSHKFSLTPASEFKVWPFLLLISYGPTDVVIIWQIDKKIKLKISVFYSLLT